jgi:hypothetical protein
MSPKVIDSDILSVHPIVARMFSTLPRCVLIGVPRGRTMPEEKQHRRDPKNKPETAFRIITVSLHVHCIEYSS